MLGTGTPNADPDRDGPSLAVVVDEASYLVDFGVGVVRHAAAAERSGARPRASASLPWPSRGRYTIKFDLVYEGVDWFERCGSETTTRKLVVR